MKTRISAGLVVLAVLLMALTAVASAAPTHTSKGKLTTFRYDGAKKTGYLTAMVKGKKRHFRVPASADCGVSYGQSGDQIPCKSLGKAKYDNKPVRVTWKAGPNGGRVASLVAVDLS
jgi:hypothetical protein